MLVFPRTNADWAIRNLAVGSCGVIMCTFYSSGWRYQQMLIRDLKTGILSNRILFISEGLRVVIIPAALAAESTTHSGQELIIAVYLDSGT